jgi:hypothetical protein
MSESAKFETTLRLEKVSLTRKQLWLSRLYIGLISFTCTEIFAGSSAGVKFYNPWPWLVTYWLYFAHLFFFASLAYYTKRTSLRSLYLWGVLFGLYESWVTKVIWFGYGGSLAYPEGCVMGGVYGFCFNETFGMSFFWHPIFGFLIPLTAVSLFVPQLRQSFEGLNWFRAESWSAKLLLGYIILVAGSILGLNSGGLPWLVATWIPVLLGLWLGYRHLVPAWKDMEQPLQLVVLGRRGFKIVTGYLILLYVSFYFFIIPYNQTLSRSKGGMGLDEALFPGTPQIVITIFAYLLVIVLLYFRGRPAPTPMMEGSETEKRNMFRVLLAIVALSLVMGAVPIVPLIIVSFIFIPVLGILLFLKHGISWRADNTQSVRVAGEETYAHPLK